MSIRRNATNSANDSKGHSLGLDGDDFLFIIFTLVVGAIILFFCLKMEMPPVVGLCLAAIPFPFVIVYLVLFRIGKPPEYQKDWIQNQLNKKALDRDDCVRNPLRPHDN